MQFGSVCSGIEAASCAWHPLGWRASFVSEIEAFPRAVLQHHYPDVPLHGDFTTIQAGQYEPIELLVGGTPCQSFSVAGLRGGLDDERGNLALEYLRLADRLRPRWLVWENVPGVLSSNGGRDFGSILGGLVELGYGFAYRVLDAQFFGVAQRRRRVFVVGHLGDWRRAAAVLFERHSLQGHPAPRRETGEGIASPIAAGSQRGSGYRNDADTADNLIAKPILAGGHANNPLDENLVSWPWPLEVGDPISASEGKTYWHEGQNFRPHNVVPVTYSIMPQNSGKDYKARKVDVAQPIMAGGPVGGNQGGDYIVQGITLHGTDGTATAASLTDLAGSLRTKPPGSTENSSTTAALHGSAVRRLTPRECERLQGFPDDYTLIDYRGKPAADGPRYKALGNSMAVPVMAWIGRRIEAVDAIQTFEEAA